MDQGTARETIVKKVYFIKRAREGEELVTLLKNKFKVLDAIRDVVGWWGEGQEFLVALRDLTDEGDLDEEERFEINQSEPTGLISQRIVGSIASIIAWLDSDRAFDIALVPRNDPQVGSLPPMTMN